MRGALAPDTSGEPLTRSVCLQSATVPSPRRIRPSNQPSLTMYLRTYRTYSTYSQHLPWKDVGNVSAQSLLYPVGAFFFFFLVFGFW